MGYRLEELFQVTVYNSNGFEDVSEERMAEIELHLHNTGSFKTYEEAKDFGASVMTDYEEIEWFTIDKLFSFPEESDE